MQRPQWADLLPARTTQHAHNRAAYAPSTPRATGEIGAGAPQGVGSRSSPSELRPGSSRETAGATQATAQTSASNAPRRSLPKNTMGHHAASQRTSDAATGEYAHAPVTPSRGISSPSAGHVRVPSTLRADADHVNHLQQAPMHRTHGRVDTKRMHAGQLVPSPRHTREPSALRARPEAVASANHPKAPPAQAGPLSSAAHSPTHRQKRAPPRRKGASSKIFCGNNALSPKLKQNGGTQTIGSPSACFRKGFGGGYYQEIPPERLGEFLQDFSGSYKKLIEQPIFYGDGPVPAGMFRATLAQCRARGFGVGSLQKAKRILKERNRTSNKT